MAEELNMDDIPQYVPPVLSDWERDQRSFLPISAARATGEMLYDALDPDQKKALVESTLGEDGAAQHAISQDIKATQKIILRREGDIRATHDMPIPPELVNKEG